MLKSFIANLSKAQQQELFDALYFMNMEEIKMFCARHQIPIAAKKGPIIEVIKKYLLTGEIAKFKSIPAISKATPGKHYPLKSSTLILQGAYKNDLKTRKFFKSLIGEHFHFTAFGQDWINERWLRGKPPTYAEFAKAWQKEYVHRKTIKPQPKKEWAYLNFIQRTLEKNPKTTKADITKAWKKERAAQAAKAKAILNKI